MCPGWPWNGLSLRVGRFLVIFILAFNVGSIAAEEKCTTCKDIVKNIMEGIQQTAKSNFGGGNTNWEENSLGSYTFSETRLVEVLENACKSSSKGCHSMLEEHEELLEQWWFKLYAKGKEKDLQSYFCINRLEVCCPNGTYGLDCQTCEGGSERPCKGNGKCQGDGTRKGKGTCLCDSGYQGPLCDECKDKYYEESRNDTHTVCKACDEACKSGCWEAGPEGCDDCVDGWQLGEDNGCQDVDECEPATPCEETEYCTNTPGSYKCAACSKACDGCTGPGADNCLQCAELHFVDHTLCTECHRSCQSACTDTTPKSCDQCKEGWTMLADMECADVNECEMDQADCEDDEYCVNTEGSFKCPNCHYACKGCTGPGANDCNECNNGYKQDEDGFCLDVDECDKDTTCPGLNSRCINTAGSYKCDCLNGYVLTEGVCTEKPNKDSPPKKLKSSSESSDKKKSSTKQSDSKTKDTKKSSKKNSKKKSLNVSYDFWQYWISLALFAVGGISMKNSICTQLLFTCIFWLYLFWFSLRFDKSFTKHVKS